MKEREQSDGKTPRAFYTLMHFYLLQITEYKEHVYVQEKLWPNAQVLKNSANRCHNLTTRRGIISAILKVNVAKEEIRAHPSMPVLTLPPSLSPARSPFHVHYRPRPPPQGVASHVPLLLLLRHFAPSRCRKFQTTQAMWRSPNSDRPTKRPTTATVKQAGCRPRHPHTCPLPERRTCPSGRLPPSPLFPSPPSLQVDFLPGDHHWHHRRRPCAGSRMPSTSSQTNPAPFWQRRKKHRQKRAEGREVRE